MTRDIAADSVQIGPLGPVSIHATIICTEVWFSRPTVPRPSSVPKVIFLQAAEFSG